MRVLPMRSVAMTWSGNGDPTMTDSPTHEAFQRTLHHEAKCAKFRTDRAVRSALEAEGIHVDSDQIAGWLGCEFAVWTPETRSVTVYARNPDAAIPLMAGERIV